MSNEVNIYQLRVHLQEIRPMIWRRILVPGSTRLSDLHEIIQRTMPWLGHHMYQFIDGPKRSGTLYSIPYDDGDAFAREGDDARKVRLSDIAPTKGSKLLYEYDFGDDWFHEIRVEKILNPEPGVRYPVCLGMAVGRLLLMTVAGRGAMKSCWRSSRIPSIRSTENSSSGRRA